MSNNKLPLLRRIKEIWEKEKIDTIIKVSKITQEIAKIDEEIRMVEREHENNIAGRVMDHSI